MSSVRIVAACEMRDVPVGVVGLILFDTIKGQTCACLAVCDCR